MKRKMLAMVCLAIAVIASLVLLGITLTGLKNDEVPQERFRRYVDEEAGVVCWILDNPMKNGESISCLPIGYTLLGE